MNIRAILALVFVAGIAVVLSSCTLMQFLNPPQGELRLLRLDMPEITGEDLPYDIVVTFEADGQPTIKKACFRWMTERECYSSPPLHCYATEAQDNRDDRFGLFPLDDGRALCAEFSPVLLQHRECQIRQSGDVHRQDSDPQCW